MARTRKDPRRKEKARRYAAHDKEFQAKMRQYNYEKSLGYKYPEHPPTRPKK